MHTTKNKESSEWTDAYETPFDETTIKPFYSNDYQPRKTTDIKNIPDLHNPVSICKYLKEYIYKQDDYVKNLSLFLYNHIKGRRSIMLVTGPPGNGKSFAAGKIKDIYSQTIIWDSSTLSKDGWTGSNKVQDILKESLKYRNPIIVLDEFDKLCQPLFSHSSNTSFAMQSEFLKLFEGEDVLLKTEKDNTVINTQNYSWILLGSFADKASEIAYNKSSSGIGFGTTKNDFKAYSEPLTIQDLIDYGMISEIASRITKICYTTPLSCEDFYYLITKHKNSPIKEIEKEYGFKLNISDLELKELANECCKSNLGIRSIKHKLICMADEQLYNNFKENQLTP